MSKQTDFYYLFLCRCVVAFLNYLDVTPLKRSASINKRANRLWGLKSLTCDLTVYGCPSCSHSLFGTDFNQFHLTLQLVTSKVYASIQKKKNAPAEAIWG